MKCKKNTLLLVMAAILFATPQNVLAISVNETYNYSFLELDKMMQIGAVINDTTNSNNLNIVIVGMLIIIIILVGIVMFSPKK